MWVKMTLPELTAYYSALEYDIAHDRHITSANRKLLTAKAQKQRRFLASRAPAPDKSWHNAAVHWSSPTGYNPIQNIHNQKQGAAKKKAKNNLIKSIRRRKSRSPRIKAYRL